MFCDCDTQALCPLRRTSEHERVLARIDLLTGALNSRAFHELAEFERQRALRSNTVDAMVAEADALMYDVKHSGKNAMKYEIAVAPTWRHDC